MAAAKLPAAPPQTPTPQALPKIEIRSRTGGTYSRAGHRWTGAWQDVPPELLHDAAKSKLLREDQHLDIRIDGKRQPRFPGEQVKDDAPPTTGGQELAAMRQSFRDLEDRHHQAYGELENRHNAAIDELADLRTRLAKLESPERPHGGAPPPHAGQQTNPPAPGKSEPTISAEGQTSTTPPATEGKSGKPHQK